MGRIPRSRPLAESPRLVALVVAAAAALALAARWRAALSWPLASACGVAASCLSTFALFAWDKRLAARGARRVSEANLWLCALLGGAAGAWAGMAWRRHKTRRWTFRLGVPLLALVQVAALAWWAARAG